MSTLCKLSAIFNASIDYLLIHNESKSESTSNTAEDLVRKYNRLDQRGKQAVWSTLTREYEFSECGL